MRCLSAVVILLLVAACGPSGSPTAPSACVVTVENLNIAIGFAVGSGTVVVNAASGCPWTATTASNFLTITGGASGNGAGTINFSVIENIGGQPRPATIIVTPATGAPVNVTVTQAAGPPPIVWNVPLLGPAIVGVPFRQALPAATGGTGTFHYQIDTFGPFPPIALILAPDGVLSGTINAAVSPGVKVFRACAVDTTQRQRCIDISITVAAATPTSTGGSAAAVGRWEGTIFATNPCSVGEPIGRYQWTGQFTASGGNFTLTWRDAYFESTMTRTFAAGPTFTFTINDQFDTITLTGRFGADFQSLTGEVAGRIDCVTVVRNTTGTWEGRRIGALAGRP